MSLLFLVDLVRSGGLGLTRAGWGMVVVALLWSALLIALTTAAIWLLARDRK